MGRYDPAAGYKPPTRPLFKICHRSSRMNRLDRALGILLMLRSGAPIAAVDLARRFEVSPRTIYRDIEALGAAGVPVYAEMGRNGGFRLSEGYFLPPVMFSVREATALLLSSALLRRMRAMPYA